MLLFENRAVYEIMWKNIVEQGRPQIKIRRMRIACWITMAPHTFPQYITLIAFPLQQLLQERAPVGTLHAHCLSWYVLTLEAPVVLHYLKAPTVVSLLPFNLYHAKWGR